MDKSRIRWGCRRGLLELDIMLCRFFDNCYDDLNAQQQADFVELLGEEDQELFRWLVGQFEPDQEQHKKTVQLIRDHQKNNQA